MTGKNIAPRLRPPLRRQQRVKSRMRRGLRLELVSKWGLILENSRLNDSSKAARRHPLNRGRKKTRVMVGSWRMKAS